MSPKTVRILFVVLFILFLPITWVSQGLSMIITGLLVLFYAFWFNRFRCYIINNGIRVEGSVLRNKSDGDGGLFSVYEFTTESGSVITGYTFIVSSGGAMGDTVSILYHPKYPKIFFIENHIASPKNYIIAGIAVGAFVIFLFAFGYWIL